MPRFAMAIQEFCIDGKENVCQGSNEKMNAPMSAMKMEETFFAAQWLGGTTHRHGG